MARDRLRILAPTRYPWQFNGPRASRHTISNRDFVPFNKLSPAIEGITIFNPWPPAKFDLIHAFNRIPLGRTPYIIGFESHLPRAFGMEHSAFFRRMAHSLASSRCKGIFAISEYAKRQFLKQHAAMPWHDALAAKLEVRYPNLMIPPITERTIMPWSAQQPMRLLFVGNHFARKGGTAVLRFAKAAQARGLPVHIDIVSSLEIGTCSWVDPARPAYFNEDLALLGLPNVTHHGKLPNAQVIALLQAADFSMLPTFSDSFGFSAIESMAHGVPVIATAQGALPEFIHDGKNGILLPLETDAMGEWKYLQPDRTTPAYEALFDAQAQHVADALLSRVEQLLNAPETYPAMRTATRATAEQLFSSTDANTFWDALYTRLV